MCPTRTPRTKLSIFILVDVRLFAFLYILGSRWHRGDFLAVIGRLALLISHDEDSIIISRIAQTPKSQAVIVSSL